MRYYADSLTFSEGAIQLLSFIKSDFTLDTNLKTSQTVNGEDHNVKKLKSAFGICFAFV